ncbi:MAG: ATP-NAD kinase [Candidatus Thorarchaeota archaeon]
MRIRVKKEEDHKTRVGVASGLEASMLEDARYVVDFLKKNGTEFVVEEKLAEILKGIDGVSLRKMDVDVLTIVGSDRFLLKKLLELGQTEIPILPLASRGQPDFLFEISATNIDGIIGDLLESNWKKEERRRLVAEISGKETPPLLNDIGIFARRSATLIRYSLLIDDEHFWKDGSDGLIVATPTGSTAYSLSVGGPVILASSPVFSIIPVNSVNPARRPLVLSDDLKVEIKDLTSSVAIEAVLDGQIRRKVDSHPVRIRRSDTSVMFVKFSEERVEALRGKLLRKTETEDVAHELPPSAKLVFKVLEYQGQLSQKEIIEETMLPPRTVRYALSLLMSEELVTKKLSLRDSRQGLYHVTNKA